MSATELLPPAPLDRLDQEIAFHRLISDAPAHIKDRIIVFAWLSKGREISVSFDESGSEARLTFSCSLDLARILLGPVDK